MLLPKMHQIETKAMFKNQDSCKFFMFCLFFSRIIFFIRLGVFLLKLINGMEKAWIWTMFTSLWLFFSFMENSPFEITRCLILKSWMELHVLRHDSFLRYLIDERFIVFQILCTYIQMWLALILLLSWSLYDFIMEYCFFLSLEVAKNSTILDFF